ncbi:MAG: hypothetical protein HYU28_12125 [Actinobacteria bacterium]|nr:hypothetical protein [Actinomycetota bacterium]
MAAMALPRDVSVEALLLDELEAIDSYLRAWGTIADFNAPELFVRNSSCKRVLYVSAPMFVPDTIPVPRIAPTGINTRVHFHHSGDVRDTVRLEAISSYSVGAADLRFRYALSIQYLDDSVGLGWQLIRPVVLIDRSLLAMVDAAGSVAHERLDRVLELLSRIIAFGSHDYVHATVLNWFPPIKNMPPGYAAIVCERPHPTELNAWHAASQAPMPDGVVAEMATPVIAPLELFSLKVHAEVIDHLWSADGSVSDAVHGLVAAFAVALDEFASVAVDEKVSQDARDYFWVLASWFIVSALPLGSPRLAEVMQHVEDDARRERTLQHLADVHSGMFDFAGRVDRDQVPWGEERVRLHDIAHEYAAAIGAPAAREHVRFLTSPRRAGGGTWADALTGRVPSGDAARLQALLARAAAALDGELHRCNEVLTAGRQDLERLRPLVNDATIDRYLRWVTDSLLAVVDDLPLTVDAATSS